MTDIGVEFTKVSKIIPDDDLEAGSLEAVALKNGDMAVEEDKKQPSVPFRTLFKYATPTDMVIFYIGLIGTALSGATLPAINIVFGEVSDAIASPAGIDGLVEKAVINMSLLAVISFCTFFTAYFCIAKAASRIANNWRVAFLEAVLRQDATFFDHQLQGRIAMILSEGALDIQNGLSDKLAMASQGVFQLIAGFGVAFYFGPILSLVIMSIVPFLVVVTYFLTTFGAEDGIMGKEAYEAGAAIVSETLSNIRTIVSLNAEIIVSKNYDSKLKSAETAAIRQGTISAFWSGALFMVMFIMYGFGFWYGSKMIADSTDDALKEHPMPSDLFTSAAWIDQYDIIKAACSSYTQGTTPYEVCACSIDFTALNMKGPNCGCQYGSGEGIINDGICFTGGKTMLVFFSVLVGAFGLGTTGPFGKASGEACIAAAKMLEVIEAIPEININAENKKKITKIEGDIELKDVHFEYNTGSKKEPQKVFRGLNLKIKAGQTVALVGESGCGKSTVARLMQRFYDPTSGSVTLDGHDLKDIDVSNLRSHIGVVSQEALLFDTTVLENIRFGKPGASDSECYEAAKNANAHEFITNFKDGYQTMVGPRGGKLSGGEKQRVAIARALLRNPPVLILDEATSALDNISEQIVQKALDKLLHGDGDNNGNGNGSGSLGKRTTIVIAHRLTTVRKADVIVVLGNPEGTSTANGTVIMETGSHSELMAMENGLYKALVGMDDGERNNNTTSDDRSRARTLSNSNQLIMNETDNLITKSNTNDDKDKAANTDIEAGGCGCNGKSNEDDEKINNYELPKNRIWSYSAPEYNYMIIGLVSSVFKGMVMPSIAIFFSKMIATWYDSDTTQLMKDATLWSIGLYGGGVLAMVTELGQKGMFEIVGERLTSRLRSDLFRAMLRQDISWFEDEKNNVSQLSSRLSMDVKLVRLVTGQSLASTIETIACLGAGLGISFAASWEMCLVMFGMMPLLGTTEYFQWIAISGTDSKIKGELEKSSSALNETVVGIREVQAFSLEGYVQKDIKYRIDETITAASNKEAFIKGVMMGMIQLIMFGVYAAAFYVGGVFVADGRIGFDDFFMAMFGMAFAASGLGQAAIFAGDAAKAAAAVENIFTTLDRLPPIDSEPWDNNGFATNDGEDPEITRCKERMIAPLAGDFNGNMSLKDVNFSYPTRKKQKIFNKMNLVIPSGKSVALVGSSGSGKSTVIQLFERFYDPIDYIESEDSDGNFKVEIIDDNENKSGSVEFSDKNIKKHDIRYVRKQMGLVGQQPILFNVSVYDNIAIGLPNATKQEVENAAKTANAHEFIINSLQDGYDTMVGIAGGKLSGGQRQRIAIARALISNPSVLLLDEATAALDNESERIVQESIDALLADNGNKRTTVVVAHRLSTIRNCDIICVVNNSGDGSTIVEQGTHDELIAKAGKYKQLIEAYKS